MNLIVALLFLICYIDYGSPKCWYSQRHYTCDSMKNLQCPSCVKIKCRNQEQLPLTSQLSSCRDVSTLNIYNCLSDIQGSPFSNMISLWYLGIESNKITKINKDMFRNRSPELSYLHLMNNRIEEIEEGSFRHAPNLKRLNLNGNQLKIIKKGIFNNLSVHDLSLTKNKLTSIEENALSNLPRLNNLFLSKNKLEHFVAGNILNHSMHNLYTIDLNDNMLTVLNIAMLDGLEELRTLTVAHNRISHIEPRTFSKMPSLRLLDLLGNQLTVLSSDNLPSTVEFLYIGDNRLTYLPNVFGRLERLRKIQIGGNPWQCSCLDEMLHWISTNNIETAFCDDLYLKFSIRPVCVARDGVRDTCSYQYDSYYHSKYTELIKSYPKVTC